jgi:hypothetical protein
MPSFLQVSLEGSSAKCPASRPCQFRCKFLLLFITLSSHKNCELTSVFCLLGDLTTYDQAKFFLVSHGWSSKSWVSSEVAERFLHHNPLGVYCCFLYEIIFWFPSPVFRRFSPLTAKLMPAHWTSFGVSMFIQSLIFPLSFHLPSPFGHTCGAHYIFRFI